MGHYAGEMLSDSELKVRKPLYNGVHNEFADMFWRIIDDKGVKVSATDSLYITRALNYIRDKILKKAFDDVESYIKESGKAFDLDNLEVAREYHKTLEANG